VEASTEASGDGALIEPLELENPTAVVPGHRVIDLVFDVRR
jgi:hypothetical protein